MDINANAINWFEISVADIDRATKFYETIFETKMIVVEMMGAKMSMFPIVETNGKVGGCLVQSERHQPGTTGTVIYLNGNPDLQIILDRIENAGGKVNMPKTLISEETGYMAFFADTEGNNIGLHSNK